ncbi:SpoIID/LytB domain protein [Thermaerobacter marianensis DSM 12885]|uniref:SpoIID/LytB domain protein n=1 Tax=Thermaerobacter marianensis (strain ATCC 700841 / DSM 12885 / JCM 10246 / 7p75a) TaxID=644966 RepID=E6SG55_THEM7|nr:SpoIID/LytB domain-containing protein [Thermaerobacter marianensis]ADU50472.1 SpoIID/LytB domain protein [Thermaerobacter marianensis DSM 12885]
MTDHHQARPGPGGRGAGGALPAGAAAIWAGVALVLIYAVLATGPLAGLPAARPPGTGPGGTGPGEACPGGPGRAGGPEPAGEDGGAAPLDPALARRFAREPQITVFDHAAGAPRGMGMETYVAHVVAGETLPGWRPDALRAQAVAARTYTVSLLMAGEASTPRRLYGTDTSTDPAEAQAFRPVVPPAVRAAVEATRGEILVYGGKPIVALFSACAAERTAGLRESFPGDDRPAPYLRPVPSPCDRAAPDFIRRWSVALTSSELAGVAGVSPVEVRAVDIARRGPSGRAVLIRIGPRLVHAADLRRQIGPDRLKSTFVTEIEARQGGVWIFRGRGWGHGVGLDQWGAEAMARDGRSYRDILAHYYPGTALVQLYR